MKRIEKIRRILKRKSTLPILDTLYFKDGYIYLSDLEVIVKIKNPLFNHSDSFFVQADPFLKMTKNMTRPVKFKNHWNHITLSSNGSFIKINTENHYESESHIFDFSKGRIIKSFNVSESDRRKLIVAGKFTSDDDLRPVMQKVYYGDRYIAASDAHKLYFPKSDNAKGGMLIHENVQKIIADYIDFTVNEITSKKGRKRYQFISSEIELEYSIESLNYPQFKRIIPKEKKFVFEIAKADLLKHLREVKSFNQTGVITLEFTKEEVKITSKNYDYNSVKSTSLTGRMHLSPQTENSVKIGFKSDYLITILESLNEDYVKISMQDPTRAVVFNDYVLLMPVLINE